MILTPQQEKLFRCLKGVNHESIWGLAIHKALNEPTKERFDALVEQLQSQNKDNPAIMKEILSAPCYNALINYQR